MRVGINGMGRIGRLALRAAMGAAERGADDPHRGNRLDIVHVNEIKGGAATSAHLLEFDSVQGRWRTVIAAEGENAIRIGDKTIGFSAHPTPAEIPWGNLGVDVVLDMVAGDYIAREIECLAEDGRLVIIAVQGGVKSAFNAGLVLRRRLTITGSTLRPRPVAFKGAIARALREHVWPLIAAGTVRPVIYRTFAAADAAPAHALMESNQHTGKIVLTWSS